MCSLFFIPRSEKPGVTLLPIIPVLGKWMGVLHGEFCIKFLLSSILGGSLQDAGLVLFSLGPKFRVLVLPLESAEE